MRGLRPSGAYVDDDMIFSAVVMALDIAYEEDCWKSIWTNTRGGTLESPIEFNVTGTRWRNLYGAAFLDIFP